MADSRDNVPVTMTITIKAENYIGLKNAMRELERYEMDGNIQRTYPFTDFGNSGPGDPFKFEYSYTVKEDVERSEGIRLDSIPVGKKIDVIKLIRNITGFGLKETYDVVEDLPAMIRIPEYACTETELIERLRTLGCDVEISRKR